MSGLRHFAASSAWSFAAMRGQGIDGKESAAVATHAAPLRRVSDEFRTHGVWKSSFDEKCTVCVQKSSFAMPAPDAGG
jgi:hypothetical protein